MADTATASTNKAVSFRKSVEREMSDNRLNAEGQPVDGAAKPKPAGKRIKPHVRKTAKRAIKRGMISEKAAKRYLKGV
jgi:hypothetical protein